MGVSLPAHWNPCPIFCVFHSWEAKITTIMTFTSVITICCKAVDPFSGLFSCNFVNIGSEKSGFPCSVYDRMGCQGRSVNQCQGSECDIGRKWRCTLPANWTLYKSADCRWISITILCVSFTNSATVGSLEQVQLCNRRIDQSADNITGLKCPKECLILKYISISRILDAVWQA